MITKTKQGLAVLENANTVMMLLSGLVGMHGWRPMEETGRGW